MSFSVSVTSPDLDRQMAVLKYYPEIAAKHWYPAMQGAARDLKTIIEPTIPVLTGRARSMFKARATGKGTNIEGRVGWWGAGQPWYINVVEYGARPHVIRPKKEGGFLWFGGKYRFEAFHPGFAGRGFMARGFEQGEARVVQRVATANERIVNELAVK